MSSPGRTFGSIGGTPTRPSSRVGARRLPDRGGDGRRSVFRTRVEESMPPVFLRAYPPTEPAPGPAFWLPFHNGELLVRRGEGGIVPVHGEATALETLQPGTPLYLGMVDGTP